VIGADRICSTLGPFCRTASVGRLLLAGMAVGLLGACAQRGPGPLYLWDTFPRQQYVALQGADASPLEQVTKMEAHAAKARASNAALPPGFRAHLGMLKLAVGDPDQARMLWLQEKQAFPESAEFIDRLLLRLDSMRKVENPA